VVKVLLPGHAGLTCPWDTPQGHGPSRQVQAGITGRFWLLIFLTDGGKDSHAERQLRRRTAAEIRLQPGAPRQRLTREQLTSLVTAMRGLASVLASADAADRAEIYGQLGSVD
jgi:hypothetical protein